jgi:hypothetical protein
MHVEMEYDDHVMGGKSKNEAIRKIAKDWLMTQEEVFDIVNIYEKEMDDIDHTGDLGEII